MHSTIPTQLSRRDIVLGKVQGTVRLLVMPWSEVCIAMGIVDQKMYGMNLGRSVQLYDLEGHVFSAPITLGEAGWKDNA